MFIIAGQFGRQRLKSPKGTQTRPTSSKLREALFNICQHQIEGARFLDLFAGSGAMGLEALSRGAAFAAFVDSHHEAIRCIESNIAHLKVESSTRILRGNVFALLESLKKEGSQFDIIYADPPYCTYAPNSNEYYSTKILEWIDSHDLLAPEGVLFIEEDSRTSIQSNHAALKKLKLKKSRLFGQAALHQYDN